MKTIKVPLIGKRIIAKDTHLFSFKKPDDFNYTAGQYISLSVDPPEIAGPGGTMRELSIASAPYENELVFALRYRETLAKRQFLELIPGDSAFIQGPFGSFGLSDDAKPVVFLAGGIGIVPFLSMLKQALHEKQSRPFFLFFSNRRHADIPFLPEIEHLRQKTHEQMTFILTLTDEIPEGWEHESGYISPLLIQKYLNMPDHAAYYISGPQRFVGGMWDILEEMGIEDTNIHGEEFTGY